MGGQPLNAPVVDLAPTADGKGYWLVASDGGIFAFGDARFHGSMGGRTSTPRWWGWRPTTATGGYWLVGSRRRDLLLRCALLRIDRGPAAQPAGERDGRHRRRPAATGWWPADGAIFAFGDARFHGSTGGMTLNAPVVGMAADAATGGYWLVGSRRRRVRLRTPSVRLARA